MDKLNSTRKITLLTCCGFYLPGYKGGGPIKTIKNLVEQTNHSLSFKILTRNHDLGETKPYEEVISGAWNDSVSAKVFYSHPGARGLRQIVRIIFNEHYDIIYLNSFFSFKFSILPQIIAKLINKKVVLGPRGEFSEGALGLKAFKKRLFIALYKALGLHKKVIYQASSSYEKTDIKKVLGSNLNIQIAADIASQDYATTLPKKSASTLNIAFLSRISPMKNLLGALNILTSVSSTAKYHIYGPIEDQAYWQQCLQLIDRLPKNIQVIYQGELHPSEVVKSLASHDLFFMPTKGENYGHVIAEAFCAGLPVLIADTTPWRHLEKDGIGWDLPLDDEQAFAKVIDHIANMTANEHVQMRQQVLSWAKQRFSQQDAIEANIKLFQEALKD